MSDYINKTQCSQQGFVKLDKGYYKMTILEKYFNRNWLDLGSKKYSGEDRLNAGSRLFQDYSASGFESMRAVGWGKEKVDCSGSPSEDIYGARLNYFSAVKSIPKEFWPVVRTVCIQDTELLAGDDLPERRKLEVTYAMKCDLCRGLDRLIEFYCEARK